MKFKKIIVEKCDIFIRVDSAREDALLTINLIADILFLNIDSLLSCLKVKRRFLFRLPS